MAITSTSAWLWDRITAPILDSLGHTAIPTGSWPRVWWCPTGPLVLLPIHAAGHHRSTETVLDRVVSSYTHTVGALAHARGASPQPAKLLVIALPDTPGQPPLPGAAAERELLTTEFGSRTCTVLTGPDATRRRILADLSEHRWLHACCHGTQNLADPASGGLLPHDWNTAGLITMADLTRLQHTGGEFAFLSACKTAVGGVTHLEEAISIAAAIQNAGWRHIVATLWSVWDQTATEAARILYPRLRINGGLDPTGAAHALHHTIRRLRDADPARPSSWAPFIHSGP
jgi:CHAT domain-containing protein